MESRNWEKVLKTHIERHSVVVVYDNVLDTFPEPAGREHLLPEIIAGISGTLQLRFMHCDLATGATRADSAIADSQQSAAEVRQPTPAGGARNLPSAINSTPDKPTSWLLTNAQALFDRINEWATEDWRLHEALLSRVRESRGRDRFVLVFPDERHIPHNFLLNVPETVRFRIPRPDHQERLLWVNETPALKEAIERAAATVESTPTERILSFVAATQGLHWKDLETLAREVRAKNVDPMSLVREYRFGERTDYWAKWLGEGGARLSEAERLLTTARDAVLGQPEAVKRALAVLAKACFNLGHIVAPAYRKPRGVMFLVGPTGVGKTMLAKKLAKIIFGDEDKCLIFNMTEYQDAHSQARLIGSPPGYVGYESGGQLTSAVRRQPFSVLLFDEIDKAHTEILPIFMQMIDEGRLTDGRGQDCDFSQTLVIFTSNAGATQLVDGVDLKDGTHVDTASAYADLTKYYRSTLQDRQEFKERPEILNKIGLGNIVPFRHIGNVAHVEGVVKSLIGTTVSTLWDGHKITLDFGDATEPNGRRAQIVSFIAGRADFRNFGMRNLKQVFEIEVLEPLAQALFQRSAEVNRLSFELAPDQQSLRVVPVA